MKKSTVVLGIVLEKKKNGKFTEKNGRDNCVPIS